ncbi:MAG TPA: DUF3099 domain-containing protein [Streptosporangiaceae bacterium]|nr:DUF3099 domain-containing protein [Streptosporangiaceae bacterium]
MKVVPRAHRETAHLVTEARRSRSEDISYRERRYLIMMGIRVVCFGLAMLLFVRGAGWVAAIPAVAAIVIPYFAVVFANGGREPDRTRRFRPYEPNLPVPYSPHQQATPGPAGEPTDGQAGPSGNGAGHGPETE